MVGTQTKVVEVSTGASPEELAAANTAQKNLLQENTDLKAEVQRLEALLVSPNAVVMCWCMSRCITRRCWRCLVRVRCD